MSEHLILYLYSTVFTAALKHSGGDKKVFNYNLRKKCEIKEKDDDRDSKETDELLSE